MDYNVVYDGMGGIRGGGWVPVREGSMLGSAGILRHTCETQAKYIQDTEITMNEWIDKYNKCKSRENINNVSLYFTLLVKSYVKLQQTTLYCYGARDIDKN